MAYKSSFDAEARKKAIDKAMPEDKPNPIMKTIRKGMTKFHEATTPPEELDALKRVKAKKAKAKAEAKAKERTKGLDERIKKSSDKDLALYTKRRESSGAWTTKDYGTNAMTPRWPKTSARKRVMLVSQNSRRKGSNHGI